MVQDIYAHHQQSDSSNYTSPHLSNDSPRPSIANKLLLNVPYYSSTGSSAGIARYGTGGVPDKSNTTALLREAAFFHSFFVFLSSGGWGKKRLKLTTLPRIFIRVACRFNSTLFTPDYECNSPVAPSPFDRLVSGYRLALYWNTALLGDPYCRLHWNLKTLYKSILKPENERTKSKDSCNSAAACVKETRSKITKEYRRALAQLLTSPLHARTLLSNSHKHQVSTTRPSRELLKRGPSVQTGDHRTVACVSPQHACTHARIFTLHPPLSHLTLTYAMGWSIGSSVYF